MLSKCRLDTTFCVVLLMCLAKAILVTVIESIWDYWKPKREYFMDTECLQVQSCLRRDLTLGTLAETESSGSLSHWADTRAHLCPLFSLYVCPFSLLLFLFLCRLVFSPPYTCQKMANTGFYHLALLKNWQVFQFWILNRENLLGTLWIRLLTISIIKFLMAKRMARTYLFC